MVKERISGPAREFISTKKRLFIDGEWVDSISGKTFSTIDPATGEVLCEVSEAGAEDVDRAVKAARRSFDDGRWSDLSPHKRARVLLKIATLIDEHRQELAELETLDNGKPLAQATGEMVAVAETFRYYAGWANKIYGDTNPTAANMFSYTLREPVGVCGQIIPWNFPAVMAAWKIAPAIAFGNTVVLKPAEQTPLTALRLAELCSEAGLPKGVVNVVTGPGSTGAAIVEHPEVDKIAFTGSTEVGRQIMCSAAQTLKRVSLELGGKSPNIVLADSDLDAAAQACLWGIFANAGQICTAGSRLLVQESIHDALLERLENAVSQFKLGHGLDPGTTMGPVVSKEQYERVTGFIEKGKEEGARLVRGGGKPKDPSIPPGYFVEPTIFDEVDNRMTIAQEEIFGPVLSVIPFKGSEDAIRLANDVIYGLAAAVWTNDIKKAHRLARAIRAGTVWINTYNVTDLAVSFGGYKQSGFGRELGKYSIDLYTQVKSVFVQL
ncbi:MAG: betaine-aldehyde dehydrogenase [Acidimicrobiia bacterium]